MWPEREDLAVAALCAAGLGGELIHVGSEKHIDWEIERSPYLVIAALIWRR